jgi:hypothetical protein
MTMTRRRETSEPTAPSSPGLSRPSTSSYDQPGFPLIPGFVGNPERRWTLDRVDGRDKPGHDGEGAAPSLLL